MSPRDTHPHVVHVLGSPSAGGAQRSVLQLIRNWNHLAVRHSIVCILSAEGEFRELFEQAGISLYYCPVRWSKLTWVPSYRLGKWIRMHSAWTFPIRFATLLKQIGADLVHSHVAAYIHLQVDAGLRKRKIPFIWTIHGMYRSRGEASRKWSFAIERIRVSPYAAVTAVCRAALEDVLGDAGLSPGKARPVYNGIALSGFERKGGADRVLRGKLGLADDVVLFGFAGRLIPIKRLDLVIEAFSSVVGKGHKAGLVIAGEGPLRLELAQLARELGVQGDVHLIGYQANMREFWSSVDVGILASDSEGLPMALLEACACGVPCIATRVGGMPEVLSNGAGILVEPGDPRALAMAMSDMLDPRRRREFGRKALEVAERFSLDRTVREYARLYGDFLFGMASGGWDGGRRV